MCYTLMYINSEFKQAYSIQFNLAHFIPQSKIMHIQYLNTSHISAPYARIPVTGMGTLGPPSHVLATHTVHSHAENRINCPRPSPQQIHDIHRLLCTQHNYDPHAVSLHRPIHHLFHCIPHGPLHNSTTHHTPNTAPSYLFTTGVAWNAAHFWAPGTLWDNMRPPRHRCFTARWNSESAGNLHF